MGARFRPWRQQTKQRRVTILVVAIILVVIALMIVEVKSYGTGFAGKTLWDWLNLLGVLAIPAAVGLGTIWFTRQQAKVSDAENKDNQRETALQAYIDKMLELLLEKKFRKSAKDDEIRTIARVRTLTVLRGLDAIRKASVLQFLYESGLVDKNKCIIDLSRANFSGAILNEANLRGADPRATNFLGANLSEADLSEAILNEARPISLRPTSEGPCDVKVA